MDKYSPIAVFDSGVGSYSIVRVIRKLLPKENIIYLADRASFPYGGKTHEQLKQIVVSSINFLEKSYHPKVIIIASNTPSIQVLDELENSFKTKIIGVFPPAKEASILSKTKYVAILATKGAVISQELDGFINKLSLPKDVVIIKANASPMIELVETGLFQTHQTKTLKVISSVISPILKTDPLIDVMTLSSTHLPFLKELLISSYPEIHFLDPAEDITNQIKNYLTTNNLLSDKEGSLKVLTTIDTHGKFRAEGLQKILKVLGLETNVTVVNFQ